LGTNDDSGRLIIDVVDLLEFGGSWHNEVAPGLMLMKNIKTDKKDIKSLKQR